MKRYDDPKTQDKLFAFNRVKNHSFLPYRERAVLSFYAENYKWSDDQASYWSQQKICDLLGFKSEKTLRSCNKVLEELKQRNEVAYVRFASVYHDFKTLDEFRTILAHAAKSKAA